MHCSFAQHGGAIYISNDPSPGHGITFTNVVFTGSQSFGNPAQDDGGAVWMQTGDDANGPVLMTGVFFTGNPAINYIYDGFD